MLTLAAASAVLGGFQAGTLDAAEVMAEPVLVVDAGSDGDPAGLEVPAAFPAVVALFCATGTPVLSPRGPDVAVTTVADPPAPWVAVDDREESLARVAERVRACPGAAVTLVQVLRMGRGRSVEDGLVLESLAYSMLQSGPEFARWRSGRAPNPARAGTGDEVLVRRDGTRLEVTLNRPQVHNAYNRRMRDLLCEALAVAVADPDCRVLLTGAGPSFCSGGDLDEFGTSPDPVSAHLVRTARSPARLLHLLSARTEALVHGSCAGSGIELPAFASTVRARRETRMWLPELAMGLIPGAGGTVSLPRRIGPARTAWMGLSGIPVDAGTALRWGLIDGLSGD